MILAVAGMTSDDVIGTTRRLSTGVAGSPAEQLAFEFTRKQATSPASITDADIRKLEQGLGRDKAWQVIWWAARCHYMTKVADAFQFPLERNNPFEAMPGARKSK